MWICPKCQREFKNKNQNHYCGEVPKTIDEYVSAFDGDKRADLTRLRKILKNALPDAEERISWSMPTYWDKRNIIHFAAAKKFIGLYAGPKAVLYFADVLSDYDANKGTIRIPYGKIDDKLIEKIAVWCGKNN